MTSNNDSGINKWLKSDQRYIKVRVGEQYKCYFEDMKFDPNGGFKGKPTVRYYLKDYEDGQVREMSSGSKKLAQAMMKVVKGDLIIISCGLGDRDTKEFEVLTLQPHDVSRSEEKETIDITDDPQEEGGGQMKIPF